MELFQKLYESSKYIFNFLKPAKKFTYVPPGLTFKNPTCWLHSIYEFPEQTADFGLYNINSSVFITEVEGVYSAVRTGSLNKRDRFCFLRVKLANIENQWDIWHNL